MAGLLWTVQAQDTAALAVFSRKYTDLLTYEKAILDGAVTAPTATPLGWAGYAYTKVQQFGQWYEQAGISASTGPSVWEHVLVAETAFTVAATIKGSDRADTLRRLKESAWAMAIDSYSLADANAATISAQTVHYKMIRALVINHLIRRPKRLYVPVGDIDQATQYVLNWLWNRAQWNFRRRAAIMSIAANGTVTFDITETVDSIATEKWYYDSTNTDTSVIATSMSWLNADNMALAKASYTSTETGKPEFFRTQLVAGTGLSWIFSPAPDQAYTLRGEVYTAAPAAAANATDTAPFTKFPAEFLPHIPELVLGYVLLRHTREEAFWSRAVENVESLLPIYEDRGAPETRQSAGDDYHDWEALGRGGNFVGGRM